MKNLSVFFALGLFQFSAASAAITCVGIQDNDGATVRTATFLRNGNLKISYVNADSESRTCVLKKDESYKPRTPKPKKDRYKVTSGSKNCASATAMVSRTLESEDNGYIDIVFPCEGGGGCAHGEPGPIESFRCTEE